MANILAFILDIHYISDLMSYERRIFFTWTRLFCERELDRAGLLHNLPNTRLNKCNNYRTIITCTITTFLCKSRASRLMLNYICNGKSADLDPALMMKTSRSAPRQHVDSACWSELSVVNCSQLGIINATKQTRKRPALFALLAAFGCGFWLRVGARASIRHAADSLGFTSRHSKSNWIRDQ